MQKLKYAALIAVWGIVNVMVGLPLWIVSLAEKPTATSDYEI